MPSTWSYCVQFVFLGHQVNIICFNKCRENIFENHENLLKLSIHHCLTLNHELMMILRIKNGVQVH